MLVFYDKVLNKVACLGIDMSNMDLVRIVQVFHYRLRIKSPYFSCFQRKTVSYSSRYHAQRSKCLFLLRVMLIVGALLNTLYANRLLVKN